IREGEAHWRIEIEDRGRAVERENILLETRFNIMERIRRLAEFDKETSRITSERAAQEEQRKIDLLKAQITLSEKRVHDAKEFKKIDEAVISAEQHEI